MTLLMTVQPKPVRPVIKTIAAGSRRWQIFFITPETLYSKSLPKREPSSVPRPTAPSVIESACRPTRAATGHDAHLSRRPRHRRRGAAAPGRPVGCLRDDDPLPARFARVARHDTLLSGDLAALGGRRPDDVARATPRELPHDLRPALPRPPDRVLGRRARVCIRPDAVGTRPGPGS